MKMKGYIATILLFVSGVIAEEASFDCGDPQNLTKLSIGRGILRINRNKNECGFRAEDTNLLVIRTDNLKLKFNDSIEIVTTSAADPPSFNVKPPFDAGFLITGIMSPNVVFKFNTTDNTTMEVEYFLNTSIPPFNSEVNNQFVITPLNVTNIDLAFTKTLPNPVHVETEGAITTHTLFFEPTKTINVKFLNNQKVTVRSSPARSDCSNNFADAQEASHEINGPSNFSEDSYRCVNIFQTSLTGQAHYVADFSNFVDLTDVDDVVSLDDGSASFDIVKSSASDYSGEILTFEGKTLTVIYDSPYNKARTHIQFKLTVKAVANGGIIDKPAALAFPSGGQVDYLLVPDSQQYAAIEFPANLKLQNTNITISAGKKIIAEFTDNTRLPPIIASNEPNTRLSIKFSGKSFDKLFNAIQFKSLATSCHRITSTASGSFSVIGAQGLCYWTIASGSNVGLSFDHIDLASNGCLTIQPLSLVEPIFSKCNITPTNLLPTFVIKQAYIKVNFTSNTSRLDASLSTTSGAFVRDANSQAISSQGYPVSYVWSSESNSYVQNVARGSYVVTPNDLDIRTGEKLYVNNMIATNEDMTFNNATAINVTIARSPATKDFGIHRGFKVSTTRFDQIIVADLAKKSITTPKNLTSLLLKISSPGTKEKFGKRIFVTASSNHTGNFSVSVHDGRSLTSHFSTNLSNVSSTSDTLLLSFTSLPELIIEYATLECNTTSDHVCDNSTRCVPADKLCKGVSYCDDGTDLRLVCSGSGPMPQPKIIETGIAGITVFILCVLMLTLGAVSALYGPDTFKNLENRFRSGQYTTFTSTD